MSPISSEAVEPKRPLERWLLAGLVAIGVAADLSLTTASSGGTELHRLVLAGFVLVAVSAVIVVGIARDTVHPVALVVGFPLAILYAYTGLLLPWTQLSFSLGQFSVELVLSVPVVGGLLAQVLFGGFALSQTTLQRAFFVHSLTLGLAVLAMVAWLVRGYVPQRR